MNGEKHKELGLFVKTVQELDVYKKAFELQQDIFRLTKDFPKEEIFSLTDQIRRSSRSICANLSEAWAKRRYPAHFVSKLSDADGEREETLHWIQTAFSCRYIDAEVNDHIKSEYSQIGGMLNRMMRKPEAWCFKEKN